MILELDVLLLVFSAVCAAGAISVKDLLASVMLLGGFSFFMCLLWTEMGSVDVAFTEAAVGAGVSTLLFIVAVFKTERRAKE